MSSANHGSKEREEKLVRCAPIDHQILKIHLLAEYFSGHVSRILNYAWLKILSDIFWQTLFCHTCGPSERKKIMSSSSALVCKSDQSSTDLMTRRRCLPKLKHSELQCRHVSFPTVLMNSLACSDSTASLGIRYDTKLSFTQSTISCCPSTLRSTYIINLMNVRATTCG